MAIAPVSVIIPSYNRRDSVCIAIESALNQTIAPAQVIVIDDGSTDDTTAVIQSRFPQIVSLQQSNQGVSAARNAGIAIATQPWIAFLDSDDRWFSHKLETQMDAIEKQPACVLCHCDEIWIRNGTRVNPMNKHRKRGGFIFEHCLPLCAISPSAVVVKRSVLMDLGSFDESLPACEDYDLWLRLCSQYPVEFVDEALLEKTGGHADQLSRKYWGMDRFRLTALAKLLRSGSLTAEQHAKALTVFTKKYRIVFNGAKKHDNLTLIAELQEQYKNLAEKQM